LESPKFGNQLSDLEYPGPEGNECMQYLEVYFYIFILPDCPNMQLR